MARSRHKHGLIKSHKRYSEKEVIELLGDFLTAFDNDYEEFTSIQRKLHKECHITDTVTYGDIAKEWLKFKNYERII